jgi:hypothetical protein
MPPLPSALPRRCRRPPPLPLPPVAFPSPRLRPPPQPLRRKVAAPPAAGRTCLAYSDDDDDESDADESDADDAGFWRHRAAVAKLRRMICSDAASKTKVPQAPATAFARGRLTGPELRHLVRRRFGRSHLCAIKRHGRAYVLEVSGRALEDVVGYVLPTEAAYAQNLEAIAAQIAFWEMDEYVREALAPLGGGAVGAGAGSTTTTYAAAAPPTTRFAGLIDCPLLIYLRLIPRGADPQALS